MEKLKAVLHNITECPICRETLTDARVLPCVHSFCLKCLQTWGKDKTAADSSNECPLCRKPFTMDSGGIEALPVNFFINKLIDVNKASDKDGSCKTYDQFCDICLGIKLEEMAEGYCVECREHLCSTCLQRHAVQKSSKSHKTVALTQKPSAEELLKTSVSYCQIHQSQEVNLYCTDCLLTCCVVCYVAKHKEHKCTDITSSSNELSQLMDQFTVTIKDQMHDTGSIVKQIDLTLGDLEEQVKAATDSATQKYEEMKALLSSQHEELLNQLSGFKSKRQKELQTLKEESEHELIMMNAFEQYWNEVKAKGSACDIVQTASSLQKRAEDLITQHEEQQNEREEVSQPSHYKLMFIPTESTDAVVDKLLGQMYEEAGGVERKFADWRWLMQCVTPEVVLPGGPGIAGISTFNNELFIVRNGSSDIEVYNLKDLKAASRQITVAGLVSAGGIVSCRVNKCLYVSNQVNPSYIHKIGLDNDTKSGWQVPHGPPYGLSIAREHNLLVSFTNQGRIDEYDTTGGLVRIIQLSGINGIYHAVELRSGHFAVATWTPQQQVCVIDACGTITYTSSQGSSPRGTMSKPIFIEVDELGNLFVADHGHSILRVFDETLRHLGDISNSVATTLFGSSVPIANPRCFCWDRNNAKLLVGDSSGRLLSINTSV